MAYTRHLLHTLHALHALQRPHAVIMTEVAFWNHFWLVAPLPNTLYLNIRTA